MLPLDLIEDIKAFINKGSREEFHIALEGVLCVDRSRLASELVENQLPSELIEGINAFINKESREEFRVALDSFLEGIPFKRLQKRLLESDENYSKRKKESKRLRRNIANHKKRKAPIRARRVRTPVAHLNELKTAEGSLGVALERILRPFKVASIRSWARIFKNLSTVRLVERIGRVLSNSTQIDRSIKTEKIAAAEQVDKSWIVEVLDADDRWHDHLEVKKSTLQGARLGLFAGQDFEPDTLIGVYIGVVHKDIHSILEHPDETMYTMSVEVNGETLFVDPSSNGISKEDEPAFFFGIHYANDPFFEVDTSQGQIDNSADRRRSGRNNRSRRPARIESPPAYNMEVHTDLKCFTTTTVRKGEELFLNYDLKDQE